MLREKKERISDSLLNLKHFIGFIQKVGLVI